MVKEISFFFKNRVFRYGMVLALTCSYLYEVIYGVPATDDIVINSYFDGGLGVTIGRWPFFVLNKMGLLGFDYYIPILTDLVSLIILGISALVLSVCIRKALGNNLESEVLLNAYMIFSIFFSCFCLTGYVFIYYLHNGICLGYFLIAISLYLYEMFFWEKNEKIWYFVGSSICVCLAISFYESFALVYIMGWAIISVARMLDNSVKIIDHFKGGMYIGTSLIVSIIVRSAICKVLGSIFSLSLSMRNPSKTILLDTIPRLKAIIAIVINNYILQIDKTYVLLLDISIIVIGVSSFVLAIRKRNILYIAYLIVMLFGLFGLAIFEGGLPERCTQSMNLFIAFAMMILFIWITKFNTCKWVKIIGIFFILILGWNNCCYMNVFFNGEVKNFQKNVRMICNIGDDICNLGYSNKVICVIGKTEIIENRLYNGNSLKYPNGLDTIPWSTEGAKPLQSLFYYLGYDFCFESMNEEDEYSTMPAYPQEGYILDRGDYIVVKIGNNL